MDKYIIYCHTNLVNGYKYIGQTCQEPVDRWGRHGEGYINKKLNKRSLGQAILDYGWENFSHEILEKDLTLDEANEREQYWINYYNTWVENEDAKGYNLTRGGGNNRPVAHVSTSQVCITVSDEDKKIMEKIAKREERTVSWVVRKAITQYIEKYKENKE